MKSWKIKFKKNLYEELEKYLFGTSPKENGCFLLAKHIDNILFVTDICYPDDQNWLKIDEDSCIPAPAYISKSISRADDENKAIIFVHTHPKSNHPSTFSYIDIVSNESMFKNLSELIDSPISSLVFSRKGIHGTVFWKSTNFSISDYSIVGRTIEKKLDADIEVKNLDRNLFDRQVLFMKESGIQKIANINIAIVGLGGIGSPLAVMLAKMGVQKITFFDADKVERHNLPRILGANKSSIGKYKAIVVKDFIKTFADIKIEVHSNMIKEPGELKEFDLIFGCVDNHTTRDILNSAAILYAIPLIDSGCAIPLNENGKVEHSVQAVSTVMPDTACLWCSKVINAVTIMEEGLSDTEIEKRIKDGYTLDVNNAPSVICLTNSVASFAINRMLNILGIYSDQYPDRVILDYNSTEFSELNFKKSKKCTCTTNNPF